MNYQFSYDRPVYVSVSPMLRLREKNQLNVDGTEGTCRNIYILHNVN